MSNTTLEETVTVELGDTDMARFIHFASVVRYFDVGLRNVLEASGLSFRKLFDRGLGLPIVNISCDYKHPMYYGDKLTIRTDVANISEKTMTLEFTFTNEDDTVTAEGSLTASFFDIDNQQGTELPDDIRENLSKL